MGKYQHSIIEDFRKNPVCSIAQAIDRIKELTGIERKPAQVRAFMRRHGFKYRKPVSIPGKVNTEKQKQFPEQDLNPAMEKAKAGRIELLFGDAAHFTLSAFLCMVWSQVGTFLRTSHGRNRINVPGAVNAIGKGCKHSDRYHPYHSGNNYGLPCSIERKIQTQTHLFGAG